MTLFFFCIQQTMLGLSRSINKTWINGAAKTVHCIWKNKHIADLMTAPQEPLSIDLLVPAGVLICRCTRDHKSCIKQAGHSNTITDRVGGGGGGAWRRRLLGAGRRRGPRVGEPRSAGGGRRGPPSGALGGRRARGRWNPGTDLRRR